MLVYIHIAELERMIWCRIPLSWVHDDVPWNYKPILDFAYMYVIKTKLIYLQLRLWNILKLESHPMISK